VFIGEGAQHRGYIREVPRSRFLFGERCAGLDRVHRGPRAGSGVPQEMDRRRQTHPRELVQYCGLVNGVRVGARPQDQPSTGAGRGLHHVGWPGREPHAGRCDRQCGADLGQLDGERLGPDGCAVGPSRVCGAGDVGV